MLSITRKSVAALAIAGLALGPIAALADALAPTVTLSSTAPDPTGDNPIMFTATISDPVTDFDASDISVTYGQVVSFSGSGTSYTFGVKAGDGDPNHDPQPAGLVEVRVLEHSFSNNQASNYISRWYQADAATSTPAMPSPTVTITSGPSEGATTTSPVTFEFTTDGNNVMCSIGADASTPYFSCGSPQTYSLGDSSYLFRVTATNSNGSASTTVSRNFTVSGTAATSTATTTDNGSTTSTSTPTGGGTPAPTGGSTPAPNGGGTPPSGNGQVVGSSATAPGGSGLGQSGGALAGFTNPNTIIPTVPNPASTLPSPVVTTPTPTVTTSSGSSGTVARSGTSASRSNTVAAATSPEIVVPTNTETPPTVAENTNPLSTDGQTAAVAQAGPSGAVWFWGAIILLALAGMGWLFYRSA